ncbi:MAG: type I-F CRISPR-associated endoribonuclease Cas6/Csy4 [Methylococcales bacterium]|nr:type I-F CRISPR-associated endoribonuclease Cas6/Csy4 [Methylococcales bacterium]
MKYYLEMTLLPNEEIPLFFLWEKVYQQLHLALVEQAIKKEVVDNSGNKKLIKVSKIGISFPSQNVKRHHLGHQLRVFAPTQQQLEQFNAQRWFDSLSDYVHLTRIRAVPDTVKKYGCYFRIQTQNNNEQLSNRRSRRLNISIDEAMKHFASREEELTDAPFIYVKSSSSGERFPLFIGHLEQAETSEKSFSCYGLSKYSTVPIF